MEQLKGPTRRTRLHLCFHAFHTLTGNNLLPGLTTKRLLDRA